MACVTLSYLAKGQIVTAMSSRVDSPMDRAWAEAKVETLMIIGRR